MDPERKDAGGRKSLALRLGLAGALGAGALVTGFILTRPGRKLMSDVLRGRTRTPLEARVLDAFWSDRTLGRRALDVRQSGPGRVVLLGSVASTQEVDRAVALAGETRGVEEVRADLEVDAEAHRRSRLGAGLPAKLRFSPRGR